MDDVKTKKKPPAKGAAQTRGSPGISYAGPSMRPLFHSADGLIVRPYTKKEIKAGDVVVFLHPNAGHKVVHRVVRVNKTGIITRGDNNNHDDPWILKGEDIIGRVVSVRRINGTYKVHGGKTGIRVAMIGRAKKVLAGGISSALRPVYHLLIRAGLLQRGFSSLVKMKILCFQRPNGTEMQLVLGRKVIGRCMPGTNQWRIIRPFRVFIDESSLPPNHTDGSILQGRS